jgi:hypothetical protein
MASLMPQVSVAQVRPSVGITWDHCTRPPQGCRLHSCRVVCGSFTNPRISSPSVEPLLTLRFVIPQDPPRRETRIVLCPGGQVGAEFLPLLANP